MVEVEYLLGEDAFESEFFGKISTEKLSSKYKQLICGSMLKVWIQYIEAPEIHFSFFSIDNEEELKKCERYSIPQCSPISIQEPNFVESDNNEDVDKNKINEIIQKEDEIKESKENKESKEKECKAEQESMPDLENMVNIISLLFKLISVFILGTLRLGD